MSEWDFERAWADAAKLLGVSASFLRTARKLKRAELGIDGKNGRQGRQYEFPTIDEGLSDGPGRLSGAFLMAKRTLLSTSGSPVKPKGRQPRPGIVHSSVYLPVAIHEALREVAFRERLKIHDIILEGIEMALSNRGRRK